MFRDRDDAGLCLAQELKHRELCDPVVLAIPCGGVVVGAILARELGAELDVILSRKLCAPGQPGLSIGAIAENGEPCLNHFAREVAGVTEEYLTRERERQLAEIARYRELFRAIRPPALLGGRSVILTDDGIATGSTMLAALRAIKSQHPCRTIVAVPVASLESSQSLEEIRRWCDEFVCLHSPRQFWAIDQFYSDFRPVQENQACDLLDACCTGGCRAEKVTA